MVALAPAIGLVAAAYVVVQTLELQGDQHHAAMTVDYGFGQARGAAGVDDPQRVVERQPLGRETCSIGIISRCNAGVVSGVSYLYRSIQIGHQHHMLHAGQALAQLLQNLAAVYVLACIVHAVHGDQRLGRYLLKRSSTAWVPMSGAQMLQMAPRLAQARKAIMASGILGR